MLEKKISLSDLAGERQPVDYVGPLVSGKRRMTKTSKSSFRLDRSKLKSELGSVLAPRSSFLAKNHHKWFLRLRGFVRCSVMRLRFQWHRWELDSPHHRWEGSCFIGETDQGHWFHQMRLHADVARYFGLAIKHPEAGRMVRAFYNWTCLPIGWGW